MPTGTSPGGACWYCITFQILSYYCGCSDYNISLYGLYEFEWVVSMNETWEESFSTVEWLGVSSHEIGHLQGDLRSEDWPAAQELGLLPGEGSLMRCRINSANCKQSTRKIPRLYFALTTYEIAIIRFTMEKGWWQFINDGKILWRCKYWDVINMYLDWASIYIWLEFIDETYVYNKYWNHSKHFF